MHVRFHDEGNHPIIFFSILSIEDNNAGSGKILLSGGEIKSTGKMTEETVPVSPYRPFAYSDDDVVPVKKVTNSLEPSSARVKFLLSLQVFLTIFYENRSIQILCGEDYPPLHQVR